MGSTRAVGGLPCRFFQIARDQAEVEIVEQRAVVQQRSPAAALSAARDLSTVQHEVPHTADSESPHTEAAHDWLENDPVAARHVAQFRTPVERERQRVVQTSRADHDRSAPRRAPDDGYAVGSAGVLVNVPLDHRRVADDHGRVRALPES